MKIVYIANSRFPSEKAQSDQVMAMCSAFAGLGHAVTLLVPDRQPVVAPDPFEHYQRPQTFSFLRVPCVDALRYRWLGSIGLWIQTATFLWNARQFLRRIKPDLVYSRELYAGLFGQAGQIVWEAHSLHRSWLARRSMRRLNGIVTLTQAAKQEWLKAGVAENKILIEPDAVDPQLFEDVPLRADARRALGIAEREFVCLYTGKLTTMGNSKGVELAMEAILRLRRASHGAARLLIVGATPEELRQARFQSEAGIDVLGHQPQRELKRFYAAADVVLMPFPYTEHYAFFMSPLKLFEYLLCGVPIIASDLPSVREVVSEREVFFLPAPRLDHTEEVEASIRTIMDLIDRISAEPEEAQAKVQAAQALGRRFTWRARAARIVEFVGRLAG